MYKKIRKLKNAQNINLIQIAFLLRFLEQLKLPLLLE